MEFKDLIEVRRSARKYVAIRGGGRGDVSAVLAAEIW